MFHIQQNSEWKIVVQKWFKVLFLMWIKFFFANLQILGLLKAKK